MPVSVWMGLVSFTAKKYSIHLIYSSLFCPTVVWTSSRSFIRLDMFKLDLEWTVEGRGRRGASGKVRRLLIYDSKLVSIQTPG